MSDISGEKIRSNGTASESLAAEAEVALGLAWKKLEEAETILNSAKAKEDELAGAQAKLAAKYLEAESKLQELNSIATAALAMKTQITDIQTVIATKSDHIEQAQKHADKVRGDLDRTLTAATKSTVEAEGLKERAQAAADSGSQLVVQLQAGKGTADADLALIQKDKEGAKEAFTAIKGLAEKSAIVEQRVAAYEKRLGELEALCKAQLKTITELLPGATSAGLASAFDGRRKTFLQPGRMWQWIFVGSIGLIVLLAGTGLWQTMHTEGAKTYHDLFLVWLARLPMVGALVWLAMHASRESALAKRLEEDYGYKATVAASFQGFMEQMKTIGASATTDTPLAKLCQDTLSTIATPPGRIYEKQKLIVSPGSVVNEMAETVLGPKPKD